MSRKQTTFRIYRFKPSGIDPPRFEEFKLTSTGLMTVLEALESIRHTRDASLMYRRSCHHASCGTCAVRVNGEEKLACATLVDELAGDRVIIEPLNGFRRLGDLVIDPARVWVEISPEWTNLKPADQPGLGRTNRKNSVFTRFEDCIECGACISACPVSHETPGFMGPAALSAMNNEIKKNPKRRIDLLSRAASPQGVAGCRRALECSRVCPTGVAPARHIQQLRKKLAE